MTLNNFILAFYLTGFIIFFIEVCVGAVKKMIIKGKANRTIIISIIFIFILSAVVGWLYPIFNLIDYKPNNS